MPSLLSLSSLSPVCSGADLLALGQEACRVAKVRQGCLRPRPASSWCWTTTGTVLTTERPEPPRPLRLPHPCRLTPPLHRRLFHHLRHVGAFACHLMLQGHEQGALLVNSHRVNVGVRAPLPRPPGVRSRGQQPVRYQGTCYLPSGCDSVASAN